MKKYYNSNLCQMLKHILIKGLQARILVYSVLPWYSTWAILEQQSCQCSGPASKKSVQGCEHFFLGKLIQTHGSVVITGKGKLQWVRQCGFDSCRCEVAVNYPAATWSFCVALSLSELWKHWHTCLTVLLCCCILYNFFLSWILSVAISSLQGLNS